MKNGFTLIEVVIVLLIIGLLARFGIPRFFNIGITDRDKFIRQLNDMTQLGAISAQQSGKVQKIILNFQQNQLSKLSLQEIDAKTPKKVIDVVGSLELVDILINGKSIFTAGATKISAYFLINQQGITQDVIIEFIDNAIRAKNPQGGQFRYELNPFIGQFGLI